MKILLNDQHPQAYFSEHEWQRKSLATTNTEDLKTFFPFSLSQNQWWQLDLKPLALGR
jgi:hypothetical protein